MCHLNVAYHEQEVEGKQKIFGAFVSSSLDHFGGLGLRAPRKQAKYSRLHCTIYTARLCLYAGTVRRTI